MEYNKAMKLGERLADKFFDAMKDRPGMPEWFQYVKDHDWSVAAPNQTLDRDGYTRWTCTQADCRKDMFVQIGHESTWNMVRTMSDYAPRHLVGTVHRYEMVAPGGAVSALLHYEKALSVEELKSWSAYAESIHGKGGYVRPVTD